MSDQLRLAQAVIKAIPQRAPAAIDWAPANVRLPGSARSERFDPSITPWLNELLLRLVDGVTRVITYVKPIQCGGSVFGEVALLYLMTWGRGFLQYNWQNDKRARERWNSRIEKVLEACPPVKQKLDELPRFKANDLEIDFGNVFFRMQGALVDSNLDSDSVRYQINEEVHNWEPGHLAKAYGRTTAIWNYLIANISNAGKKGDQLHQALIEGTHQLWEVKCPGCSNRHHAANAVYHVMRTRWDDRKPKLGGLRYNADGCRRDDGTYDYNKLEPTIRFQMPCGFKIHEDPAERRALSLSGRYSEPTNKGAHLSNRSYTLEAVSVDYIPWIKLIQEKHKALFARKRGDPEPYRRYVCERECGFYDPEEVPIVGKITLNSKLRKTRAGLPNRVLRAFALDRQQGSMEKGEFPHWWIVIRDFDENANSLLVFEGKVETDEGVIEILNDHECVRHHGVADSGDDTTHVYLFCLKHGINAVKGGGDAFYPHPGGVRRIFSVEKPLHTMIGKPPLYDYVQGDDGDLVPDPREPLFWIYSKGGIRERLDWLRSSTKWEVPGDVSDDYQAHMESEERRDRQHTRTGELIVEYVQLKKRNDLYVCEGYIAMEVDASGLIGGADLPAAGENPDDQNKKTPHA